jgi:imidazole glycerol-phosphate synthase subunit HisH
MITIIDYGLGNLGSINNMFKWVGVDSKITSDVNEIKKAKKIILPGVGSFDTAMKLINSKYKDVLNYKANIEKIPILGICLGMQLMTKSSQEGNLPGLGWINAKTIKFKFDDNKLKIPHMGWNTVKKKNECQLINNLNKNSRFYFVHSYYVKVQNNQNSILKTNYGINFDAAFNKKNIYGVQFHPEKSHKYGKKIFENFAKIK